MNALRQVGSVRRRLWRRALLARVPVARRDDVEHVGTTYGGWELPTSALSKDSICYLIGTGEDISFDLALIERYGCEVHAFDPVPRARTYVEELTRDEPRYTFHPVGVWSQDTTLRFHVPETPEYISHSATNIKGTSDYIEAEVRTLGSLMEELGDDHVDLLKISAEGAELEIIRNLLDRGLDVRTLCVEFAQPAQRDDVETACDRLLEAGFSLVAADRWKWTFLRQAG